MQNSSWSLFDLLELFWVQLTFESGKLQLKMPLQRMLKMKHLFWKETRIKGVFGSWRAQISGGDTSEPRGEDKNHWDKVLSLCPLHMHCLCVYSVSDPTCGQGSLSSCSEQCSQTTQPNKWSRLTCTLTDTASQWHHELTVKNNNFLLKIQVCTGRPHSTFLGSAY